MISFRFEYFENVISKHNLKKVNWTQAAQWAWAQHLDHNDWTVARVQQLDADTVEIIKRKDVNKSICYKFGWEQMGVYQRVIINRKEQSVSVDRFDMHWLEDAPYLGKRDQFRTNTHKENTLDFYRHEFWLPIVFKFPSQALSNYSAWQYKKAFARIPEISKNK